MTGITVIYNTVDLFEVAYNSFRKFYPSMRLIIIDGSERTNACYRYIAGLKHNPNNHCIQLNYNIGHGRGMDYALRRCTTKQALVFDSDIELLQDPLPAMQKLMTPDIYGTGWVYEIGRDGYDYGTPGFNHEEPIPYMHPYFMLLNVGQYFNYHRFVHHGAPCYKAMVDLYDKGQSWRVVSCPILTGHTSSEGMNWKGKPNDFVKHDFGGTRMSNKKQGKNEIEGTWE
jgi:hypothetical protein